MSHSHTESLTPNKALLLAFIVNTTFLIVELVGAFYADSLTLLADAFHMFTDSASLLLAIGAAYLSARAADELRTFGYQRAEVIGGLLNGFFLIGTVLYILYDAYQRLQTPTEVQSEIVIVIGFVGLGANLLAAYLLHSKQQSINVRGAYLHLIADAFGSIAAIVSGVAIYITGLYVIDIIAAILITGIILLSVKELLYEAVHILLQGKPLDIEISQVESLLLTLEGVEDVHHIHVWSLSSSESAMSAHLVVTDVQRQSEILDEALTQLEEYGIDHPTIQIEGPDFEQRDHECFVTEKR